MSDTIDADELRLVVRRAQRHDPDAWERLYRHSRRKLFPYARRRLPNDHAAEDAVSEAFTRAVAKIEDFTWQRAGFDAWMYGITRNIILENHRRTSRDRALADKQTVMTRSDQGATVDEIAEQIDQTEERSLLHRAFAGLAESDKEILELRVIGGLTSDEVAAVLDKKPGTVRMAQARALDRLRMAMKELEDG